ncbi:MAG TPA: porin [Thermoanaerobaculia bacterium]|nr:porin [Thermoanaerobaculia bacterium]
MKIHRAGILCAAVWLAAGLMRGDGPDTITAAGTEATLTPSPAPSPTPAPAPAAKPRIECVESRGVVFRTPDGLFEGSLGFNFQGRFTYINLDAAGGGIDADEFRVRRFKLCLSGFALDPRLTWRLQLAFESTAANRTLDDAWINWRFDDAVQAQFGQYKTPYAREELYNDGFIQFPERAIAVDAFKPSRDIGLMAAGSFGKNLFAYQAGVFGGDGQNTLRATNHVMPMLRLVVNPIGVMGGTEADLQNHQSPALSLGANGFVNTLRKTSAAGFEALALNYAAVTGWLGRNANLFTTGEDVDIKSWGFDGQFKWHGLTIQAEGFLGQAEGKTSGVRLYASGWYGQAGFFILPEHLDVAGRYSIVDYNRNSNASNISTVSADTTYYFRRNCLKITLDYTRTHRERVGLPAANDQAFLVQVQLMP